MPSPGLANDFEDDGGTPAWRARQAAIRAAETRKKPGGIEIAAACLLAVYLLAWLSPTGPGVALTNITAVAVVTGLVQWRRRVAHGLAFEKTWRAKLGATAALAYGAAWVLFVGAAIINVEPPAHTFTALVLGAPIGALGLLVAAWPALRGARPNPTGSAAGRSGRPSLPREQ